MTHPQAILALARVMYAVAWCDDELHALELQVIEDYLSRQPGYDDNLRQHVSALARRPIDDDRCGRYLEQLRPWLGELGGLRQVQQALNLVIAADGCFAEAERRCLQQIRRVLENTPATTAESQPQVG